MYVAPKPPEWPQKRKMAVFRLKVHFSKKVYNKLSFYENHQQHSFKAFIGLSICAKNGWWGHPLLCENLAETDPPTSKMLISNQYLLIAPQP